VVPVIFRIAVSTLEEGNKVIFTSTLGAKSGAARYHIAKMGFITNGIAYALNVAEQRTKCPNCDDHTIAITAIVQTAVGFGISYIGGAVGASAGAITGAVLGASAGALAGPPGAIAGLIIEGGTGSIVGGIAGSVAAANAYDLSGGNEAVGDMTRSTIIQVKDNLEKIFGKKEDTNE
jgi:hypothetical protein